MTVDEIIAAAKAAEILGDANEHPMPQTFDPALRKFVPSLSDAGAKRVVLHDANGNPISTTEGKLAVRASELEAALENLLNGQSTAAKQDALAALVGAIDAAAVSDPAASGAVIALLKGLLSRLQTLENKIDSFTTGEETVNTELKGSNVQDSEALPVKQMPSTVTEDVINKQADIYSSINILIGQNEPPEIYGAKWDKGSVPTLTRTDAAEGKTANVGVDFAPAANDFDKLPIWGEIEEAVDEYGNVFVRIPKFYIRKLDGENFKSWQVSKRRHPGFYLPWCFWDFANNRELPYLDFGKHLATLGESNRLQSKPGLYPLINTNIINMRNYAKNNNNDDDGLTGYQQLDIHAVDVLQTLMFIEFATLNMQTVMQGYTTGQYTATHLAVVTETNTNRIVVANNHAGLYRVGQSISVGTTQGGNQIFYGRTITSIDDYDADNKAITFDGDPVDITAGNMLYNTAYKTGFSREIAASSGSIGANDGKYPCVYRGIESPFGDMYQFVDGVNITDRQAWVCRNAEQYSSNLFAHPYAPLSYVNSSAEGYVKEMGFDSQHQYASFPTALGGGSTSYYCDYYYSSDGERIARFGGDWSVGANAGLSSWYLYNAASDAGLILGGRLLKKPL